MSPFKDVKIKTFNLEDLVGKTFQIHFFREDHIELIIALDLNNGEIFALKQIHHPISDKEIK